MAKRKAAAPVAIEEKRLGNEHMLMMVNSISREKMLPEEQVFTALEEAIAFAAKKKVKAENPIVKARIDRETGEVTVTRHYEVIPEDNMTDLAIQYAVEDLPEEEKGKTEHIEILEVELGRTSAQLVKQTIMQKIKDIEQSQALGQAQTEDNGAILSGVVKSFAKGGAVMEIGRLEAILPRSECLPKDDLKLGSRLRVVIKKVEKIGTREVVTVSRATPDFMKALIGQEVALVEEGQIEIVKIVRAPGIRTKMIVRSHMPEGNSKFRNDPARIIIGAKGMHAKSIAEETGGEHMDILVETDDPAQMLLQALYPAEPTKIRIDEEIKEMEACIPEESLGLVIGSKGVNIRLISELLGWNVEVMTDAEWGQKEATRQEKAKREFTEHLGLDEEAALALAENGFDSIEEVAFGEEGLEELGFSEEDASELRERAKEVAQAKQAEFAKDMARAKDSLSQVQSITPEEMEQLVKAKILSADDLADLATDELVEALPHWREKRASDLIMSARKLWEAAEETQGA